MKRYNPTLFKRRGFMKLQGWAISYLRPGWWLGVWWRPLPNNTAPLGATSEAGHAVTQPR